ncbi:MAG: hypothetical protein A2172_04695 [Candidatus Woykebacteria bacterium RBG_13_40_15]|uniref:Solute-binding protein family 5 domain-containing protein n=1 Tax=Candidatus Woykebacteria bacterium RBG_13_40_15 TaxID=1802593 RepID=A0A1G1W734_9BACT|nr:MAG: hypothetical protein A2172_04695 [Candidatus Woykebacteria bacterium RBG_13_40_15]
MLKKIRFYLSLLRVLIARNRKKISYSFIGLLLVIFAIRILLPLAIPKVAEAYKEFKKPSFVEGVVGKPTHPNPLSDITETQKDISSLVFRGLTKLGKDGKLVPDLAESFKQTSDTEYVFNLRKDVYWQDNVKFTSDDVLYTVKLTQNPNFNSPVSNNFKDVLIEKIDDYKVKFKLKEAFAPFPYTTTIGIIPSHVPLKKYRPVGTGPFSVKKITKDQVVLTNDKFNLVFKFYKTISDAKTALKLGEIHALGGLSPQELGSIKNFGGENFYESPLPYREAVIFFNVRGNPLKTKEIRQALSYALNKEAIWKAAGGTTSVISQNELPLLSPINEKKERYPFNLDRAKELLENNKYKFEKDTWKKDGREFTLKITSIDDPELNSIVNLVKDSWSNLGLKVKTEFVDVNALRSVILPNRNFQVLVNFQDISSDPDQYVLWHTTQVQAANITGISSPKLDKILEDTRKSTDEKFRAERYKLFTTLLLDEEPAIFLYYPTYTWVVSKKVFGIDFKDFSIPSDRFNSINKWQIKSGLFDIIFPERR